MMNNSPNLLLLVLGLVIWGLWFILIYSGLSVACAIAPPSGKNYFTWINAAILISTLLLTVLLLYFAYKNWQSIYLSKKKAHEHHFILWIAVGSFLASSIATFSIGLMVLFYPPCI